GLQLIDLVVEIAPMTFDGSEEFGTGGLLGAVFFPDPVIDQLIATGDEIGEQGGVFLGLGGGRGLKDATISGQEKGIDTIGLGELAAGTGEVAGRRGLTTLTVMPAWWREATKAL